MRTNEHEKNIQGQEAFLQDVQAKPHKMGWSVRWKAKELAALKRFEKEAKRG